MSDPVQPVPEAVDQEATTSGRRGPGLGEVLCELGVDAGEIEAALASQQALGGAGQHAVARLGELLVARGVITEATLTTALARQCGLEVVNLRDTAAQPAALAALDPAAAHALGILPLRLAGDELVIAVADPNDRELGAHLARLGRPTRLVVANGSDVRHALNLAYPAIAGVDVQVKQFEASQPAAPTAADGRVVIAEDAPVVQVVNLIVVQALRDRASDVHIEPQPNRLRIRFRIDGAMREVLALPAHMAAPLVSRLKIMADMNIVEQRRPQDGQFALNIDGRDLDVRVATTTTIWGEKVVLRLLDRSRSLYRLADLGMGAQSHNLYATLARAPFGMVICSGPTGSGKTTTLYATLGEIIRADVNVMTIEDPVEYTFPEISQIQINEAAGLTFATGLRSILRQDPDIILVGEMRDGETAHIAVQAALTGHLVLSSLHATDSASALARLTDMGVEPYLVASSVNGVVAQRLVRKICPSCVTPYTPTPGELAYYRASGGPPKDTFVHGAGCSFCAGSGYRERTGVYEVLLVTDEVRSLLLAGATPRQIRERAAREGLRTLQQEGMALVAADITTIAEITRSIYVL